MNKKTLLVVEDDETIRELLVTLLKESGYKVVAVENGREALIYLMKTDREPCCVLLDLMMPQMNGYELMQILHDTDMVAVIPVIVLSASNVPKGIKGARKIMKKPVDIDVLVETVREYCGPPEACS